VSVVLIRPDGQTDMTKLIGFFATMRTRLITEQCRHTHTHTHIYKTAFDVGLCTVTGHSDHVSLSAANLK